MKEVIRKMRNEKEYKGKGVKAELGAYGASLWKRYLKFSRTVLAVTVT